MVVPLSYLSGTQHWPQARSPGLIPGVIADLFTLLYFSSKDHIVNILLLIVNTNFPHI